MATEVLKTLNLLIVYYIENCIHLLFPKMLINFVIFYVGLWFHVGSIIFVSLDWNCITDFDRLGNIFRYLNPSGITLKQLFEGVLNLATYRLDSLDSKYSFSAKVKNYLPSTQVIWNNLWVMFNNN